MDNVEIEPYIDLTSLNEIFVELWIRKFTYQIKEFDNVKWNKTSEGAFIHLSDGGYIRVEYMLDDRLCFGTHDTIYVEYMEKEKLNLDLLNKISKRIKAEPKCQCGRTATFEVTEERDPSFWTSPDYIFKFSTPVKIICDLAEMVKTISEIND